MGKANTTEVSGKCKNEMIGIKEEDLKLTVKHRERSLELDNFFLLKIVKKFLYNFIFSYMLLRSCHGQIGTAPSRTTRKVSLTDLKK